jgi:hypothetical protein
MSPTGRLELLHLLLSYRQDDQTRLLQAIRPWSQPQSTRTASRRLLAGECRSTKRSPEPRSEPVERRRFWSIRGPFQGAGPNGCALRAAPATCPALRPRAASASQDRSTSGEEIRRLFHRSARSGSVAISYRYSTKVGAGGHVLQGRIQSCVCEQKTAGEESLG